MIVDVAVCEHGKRLDRVVTPAEAVACAQAGAGRFTWIGMSPPSEAAPDEVAELYELHPLAIEDALIEEIQDQVFGDPTARHAERIFRLTCPGCDGARLPTRARRDCRFALYRTFERHAWL